jgi:hypothetical protein
VPGELQHVDGQPEGAVDEEPVGDLPVHVVALRRADLVVEGVRDQVVGEAVAPRRVAGDDAGAEEVVEGRHDGRLGQRGDARQQVELVEPDAAEHGDGAGHRARGGGERRDPAQHGLAPRQPDRVRRGGEPGAAASEVDDALLHQGPRDLGGEERIPVGAAVHLGEQVGVRRRAEQRRDHRCHVGVRGRV